MDYKPALEEGWLLLKVQMAQEPWLVWLSGWSTRLRTKGSLVRFPGRAHAGFVGQVPSGGRVRGNYTLMFLSLSFSLPSPLSKNKIFKWPKKIQIPKFQPMPKTSVPKQRLPECGSPLPSCPGSPGNPSRGLGTQCYFSGLRRYSPFPPS